MEDMEARLAAGVPGGSRLHHPHSPGHQHYHHAHGPAMSWPGGEDAADALEEAMEVLRGVLEVGACG